MTAGPRRYDFNRLEEVAQQLVAANRHDDALRIYFFMADGDSSLDAGYLGQRIAECYEALGSLHAARYWYGRALEENPEVLKDCVRKRTALGPHEIDHLL